MSEKFTNTKSETDWEYLENMTDEEIDYSDIPPLSDDFFQNAVVRMPKTKQKITIRLDPDVLAWFKSQGKGYQTHINAVLATYVQTQRRVGVTA